MERLVHQPEEKTARWIILSSAALAFGSIGTWRSADAFGLGVTEGGLHGGGWITLVMAAGIAALILEVGPVRRNRMLASRRRGLVLAASLLSLVICILNLGRIQGSSLSGSVAPGWGLYLSTLASTSLAFWAYLFRQQTDS
jgi:hypothetical protein